MLLSPGLSASVATSITRRLRNDRLRKQRLRDHPAPAAPQPPRPPFPSPCEESSTIALDLPRSLLLDPWLCLHRRVCPGRTRDLVRRTARRRCGEPGTGPFGTVFSFGGHGLVANNNIFIDCKRALGSAPWSDDRWIDALKGGQDCFFAQKLLEEVDITRPPYTTRYPELIGYLDYQPGTPRISTAARNVLVRCGELSGGNWRADTAENQVLDHDPGFVDMAGGDYTLREDSEVFDRLTEFEPIPFRKIGLYVDVFRSRLP